MKKLLIVLLALALVFAFAACGEQAEEPAVDAETYNTDIPLGGNLPDWQLEGPAYGEYVKIEPTASLLEAYADESIATLDVYYAEGSDTPYIIVARGPNTEGLTLEEFTETALASLSPNSTYDCYEENGVPAATFYSNSNYFKGLADGNFYYVDAVVFIDGDEIVTVDFYSAAEELALGDSGKYLWIPTGYDPSSDPEEMAEHGVYFYADYDESYWMPFIYIAEDHDDYEELQWYWSGQYPDGQLPVDEATYASWEAADWDEASVNAYDEAFGIEIAKRGSFEADGCTFDYTFGTYTHIGAEQATPMSDIYLNVGDDTYNIWLESDLPRFPKYAFSIFESLHSK